MGPNEALLLRIDSLESKLDTHIKYLDEKIDFKFKELDEKVGKEIFIAKLEGIISKFETIDKRLDISERKISKLTKVKNYYAGAIAVIITILYALWEKIKI